LQDKNINSDCGVEESAVFGTKDKYIVDLMKSNFSFRSSPVNMVTRFNIH